MRRRRREWPRRIEVGAVCRAEADFGFERRVVAGEAARREGHDLILDIDVQGALQVRSTLPEAVSIFIMPPNPKVLRTRLRNRSRAEGQVHEAELYRRLSEASKEIENYREYGYILVNDILDRAVEEMAAIVSSERMARKQGPLTPEEERLKEIAERCRQRNSDARIKPVLQAFGVINPGVAVR